MGEKVGRKGWCVSGFVFLRVNVCTGMRVPQWVYVRESSCGCVWGVIGWGCVR